MTHTEVEQAKAGIAGRLRKTRRAQDLTQEQLTKLSGTNQAVIQKIENGKAVVENATGPLNSATPCFSFHEGNLICQLFRGAV